MPHAVSGLRKFAIVTRQRIAAMKPYIGLSLSLFTEEVVRNADACTPIPRAWRLPRFGRDPLREPSGHTFRANRSLLIAHPDLGLGLKPKFHIWLTQGVSGPDLPVRWGRFFIYPSSNESVSSPPVMAHEIRSEVPANLTHSQ